MFCPTIGNTCMGEDCVRWNKEHGKCQEQVAQETSDRKEQAEAQILKEWARSNQAYMEATRFMNLIWKISVGSILRDPTADPELKQQLLHETDAVKVEKLLKDHGLIED